MQEFVTWIDKSLEEISLRKLFIEYFSEIEIDNIEDTYFLSNKLKGIDITFTDELIVKSIHLSSGKYLEDNKFEGELPFNLNFSYSSTLVKKLIGAPNISGGGFNNVVIGFVNRWEKFFLDSYSIHLQYAKKEDSIELITIGSLKFEDEAFPE